MTRRSDSHDSASGIRPGKHPNVREDRRAALLDTAQAVFLEKGYETATVNDVLAAAALSKGGFYHYFKSKDDVLDALRTRYTQWFLDTVAAKVERIPADQAGERLRAWIKAYGAVYLSTIAVHDLVYHSVHSSRNNQDRIAITGQIERLLEDGVARGAWHLPCPHLTATIIYSAAHGVLDDAVASRTDDMPAVMEQLNAALLLLIR